MITISEIRTKLSAFIGPIRSAEPAKNEPKLDAPPVKPAARNQRAYAGAQFSRTTSDWSAYNTSADSEIRTSLRTLRNRTRQLCRDNDYAKNAVRTIRNNVVGKGIMFQAQVPMRRGGRLNEPVNDAIESEWIAWGKADSCHTAGKLSINDIQRLLMQATPESGETVVRMVKQKFGKSRVPFALELIEADQLVDELNGRATNGNEIRMGVEVDKWQRPVAYYLYPQHPGDYQFLGNSLSRYQRVDAAEIIHLGVPDRIGQTRYVPWFHTAMKRLNNLGGYEEAEIVAARATAAVVGFISSPEGTDPAIDDGIDDGERVYDFEPGTIKELGPGETFTGFNPSRPNANMDPFVRLMLRGVAAGCGTSYESLSRDYSQSNYSSSRLALLDDRDNWRVLQQWFIENFLQKVYEAWLEMAVLAGVLNLPGYEITPELYCNVRWMPRGWESVDPQKEAVADVLNRRAGFTTSQAVIAKNGGDYEDVFKQLAQETKLLQELGLVVTSDTSATDNTGKLQAVANMTTDPATESTDSDPMAQSLATD